MLEVKNLTVALKKDGNTYPIVKNLSYTLGEGQTLAIVGESGCGKTMQALAVMGLLPPNIEITSGQILFEKQNILTLNKKERRKLNGETIALIFQDALTSLNPVLTIREHFIEVYKSRTNLTVNEAEEKIKELLEQTELPPRVLTSYPHQLSGGQRQRVMIALALTLNPKLLIADEPTTALDEDTQKQIIALIKSIQNKRKMAVIFITHDLQLAKEIADKIFVLYAGTKIEEASTKELFNNPLHPYTYGLLKAVVNAETPKGKPLYEIAGTPPRNAQFNCCAFNNRCTQKTDNCAKNLPPLQELTPKHFCACFCAGTKGERGENA